LLLTYIQLENVKAFSVDMEMQQWVPAVTELLNTGLFKMIVGVWPPRSPDATPFDFFLGVYVGDQVYVPPLPTSTPELKVRIRTTIETTTADM
jgi:hypothetical protein